LPLHIQVMERGAAKRVNISGLFIRIYNHGSNIPLDITLDP
jgi:hypothetical protein